MLIESNNQLDKRFKFNASWHLQHVLERKLTQSISKVGDCSFHNHCKFAVNCKLSNWERLINLKCSISKQNKFKKR